MIFLDFISKTFSYFNEWMGFAARGGRGGGGAWSTTTPQLIFMELLNRTIFLSMGEEKFFVFKLCLNKIQIL